MEVFPSSGRRGVIDKTPETNSAVKFIFDGRVHCSATVLGESFVCGIFQGDVRSLAPRICVTAAPPPPTTRTHTHCSHSRGFLF